MESNRRFLHFFDKDEYERLVPESDEQKNKPFPLFQKDFGQDTKLIDLIPPEEFEIGGKSFLDVVNRRISHIIFTLSNLNTIKPDLHR
jgi:hypothetical protein